MMASLGTLFNKTQKRLLTLLFVNPEESFYTNELVRAVGTGTSTVTKELKRFNTMGLFATKKVGNQIHYQANQDCPVYEEMKSLVRKTFGVTDSFKEALAPISNKINKAFIYGSFADGTENSVSDIDLMVVSDQLTYTDVIDHIDHLSEDLMRTINPTLYTTNEFNDRLNKKHYFLSKVMKRPRIDLI